MPVQVAPFEEAAPVRGGSGFAQDRGSEWVWWGAAGGFGLIAAIAAWQLGGSYPALKDFAGNPTRANLPSSACLYPLAMPLLTPAAYGFLRLRVPRATALGAAAGLTAVLVLLAALSLPLLHVLPFLGLVGGACGAVLAWAGRPVCRTATALSLLMAVLCLALSTRYNMLLPELRRPLDPDPAAYLDLSQSARGFATAYREPLYIWIVQLTIFVTGEAHSIAYRLLGVILSLVGISAVFAYTLWRLGWAAALVAGALYAYLPVMGNLAVRGYREDLILAQFLLFAALCQYAWRAPLNWTTGALLGAGAAVSLLTRLNSFVFCFAGIALVYGARALIHRDLKWRQLLPLTLAVVIPVLAIAPYLYYAQRDLGDPFYVVSTAPRFYANWEFAGKHPDFPPRDEVLKDGFIGGPLSMGTYLFKYHTVGEVLTGYAEGFWSLAAGRLNQLYRTLPHMPRQAPALLLGLQVIGMACLCLPKHLWLTILVLLFHAPILFIMKFDYFDWRLATTAYGYFFIAVGAAVAYGVMGAKALYKAASTDSPASPAPAGKGRPIKSGKPG